MPKRIVRLLKVITIPLTGEVVITTAMEILETIVLDGQWDQTTIHEKATDEIQKRIKANILQHHVGYAIYLCTGHGLSLESVHVESKYDYLPCKWL